MGIKHLWDTNTAIYHLQEQFSARAQIFIANLLKAEHSALASIPEIELLNWKTVTSNDLHIMHDFIENAFVIELEKPVSLKAADLRSRNVSDFSLTSRLKFINLWDV